MAGQTARYLARHLTGREYLLVGQAPARSADDHTRPWDSASGRRLAKKLGVSIEDLLDQFDTVNLNPALLGTRGKYDVFDERVARKVARDLVLFLYGWDHRYSAVLTAGVKVADAMRVPLLRWTSTPYCERVGGIPHPGGNNLWWNDAGNRSRATEFLTELATELASDHADSRTA